MLQKYLLRLRASAVFPLLHRLRSPDAFTLLALLCCVLALRVLIAYAAHPLGGYDEGLLFLNAQMMADGRVIYRDFYANYPPAIFQLVRLIDALGLPTIWTMRSLTIVVHFASALLAGRVVSLATAPPAPASPAPAQRSHPPFCWPVVAALFVLQSAVAAVPFAYLYAVILLQSIALLWPAPGRSHRRALLVGGLFSLLSYLRHDVCVYALSIASGAEALRWAIRRRSLFFATRREALHFAAAFVAGATLLWGPVFFRAGFSRVLHDLVFDVSNITMPARVLPLPDFSSDVTITSLNWTLSSLFAERTQLGLGLTAVALVCGGIFSLRVLGSKTQITPQRRLEVMSFLFALATVPQATGRTDMWHVFFTLPLALVAYPRLWSSSVAQFVGLGFALLPWFLHPPHFANVEGIVNYLDQRDNARFMTAEDRLVADFIQAETAPGEAIYVGCASHQQLVVCSLSPYYWGHRPGATRFMQLDPGLATGTDGQHAMIADLERNRPRLVLRATHCWWYEENLSRQPGSPLLDKYLAIHYVRKQMLGSFSVWVRRAPPPSLTP